MINSGLPKISIVTPSYNQGDFLEETIDSVLGQNYPNLEYVIIDGGSTDKSVEIIKKHERYLTYWVSEKDKGQSHAINKGLGKLSGDVFNWLNSDDYYSPGALRIVGEIFKNDKINLAAFRSNIFGKENRVSKGTNVYENLAKTIAYSRIDQPETFFRLKTINEIGGINDNMHFCMDQDLYLRYLFKYGLENIYKGNDIVANFRIHDDSKTNNYQLKFINEKDNMFLALAQKANEKKIVELISQTIGDKKKLNYSYDEYDFDADTLHNALQYFLFYRGLSLYSQSDWSTAENYFNLIDKSALTSEDARALNKIVFRNKYIPKKILVALRKLKSII